MIFKWMLIGLMLAVGAIGLIMSRIGNAPRTLQSGWRTTLGEQLRHATSKGPDASITPFSQKQGVLAREDVGDNGKSYVAAWELEEEGLWTDVSDKGQSNSGEQQEKKGIDQTVEDSPKPLVKETPRFETNITSKNTAAEQQISPHNTTKEQSHSLGIALDPVTLEERVRRGQHWELSRDPTSVYSFTPPQPHPNRSHTPRLFHFVWVSPGMREPYTVPRDLEENANEWVKMNPKWKATIWTNTLIQEHFPDLSFSLLHQINYSAWISDLSRYAILHRYGGVYLDADTYPVHPLDDLVLQYSPFTVCQGYNDANGSISIPFKDRDKCRRFANGMIATPPNTTALKSTLERSVERSFSFGLKTQATKGQNGKSNTGFHIGVTGPYLWKTQIRWEKSYTILSMKSFLPCGWRNPTKQSHCVLKNYVNDPDVYGMHRLTMV